MPNHIQNRLKFVGEKQQVSAIRGAIKGEFKDEEKTPMQIDFSKIIPCPDGMDVEIHSGIEHMVKNALKMPSHENQLIAMLENSNRNETKSPLTLNDEDWAKFIQCMNNVKSHGHIYWYDWNLANWGTKWNAYQQNDTRTTDDTIYFQTAWSAPKKIISELAKQFPDVEMVLTYADEDSGSNTGISTYKGELINEYMPESQSNEGYEIYFELNPESINDYHKVDGKYEYKDDE